MAAQPLARSRPYSRRYSLFALTLAVALALATLSQVQDSARAVSAGTTHRIQVLDSNITGAATDGVPNPAPLQVVKQAIAANDVDIVLLQEVCWGQFQELRATYGSWQWAFAKVVPPDADPTFPNACDLAAGNVVGSRFSLTNPSKHLLPKATTGCVESPRACNVDYNMLCADVIVTGHANDPIRACSTHLVAGWAAGNPGPATRELQVAKNQEHPPEPDFQWAIHDPWR
jgi:hypothetical protein